VDHSYVKLYTVMIDNITNHSSVILYTVMIDNITNHSSVKLYIVMINNIASTTTKRTTHLSNFIVMLSIITV
jgi:hypothetical protein